MAKFIFAVWHLLLLLSCTVATPLDSNIVVHTPEGRSEADVIHTIQSELNKAALVTRGTKKNSTTLDRSWQNAPLLQLGPSGKVNDITVNTGVSIVCTECYVKGVATGEITYPDSFNISQTISNVTDQFEANIKNLTSEAEDFLDQLLENIGESIFDDQAFEFPTFNYSFEVDLPPINQTNVRFSFDGLEIYMLVDTTLELGAAYTIPMFNSARDIPGGILGLALTDKLELGMALTVDLIFTATSTMDVSAGFHLQLDDGFAVNIALFGNDVSDVTYNGGHFEFLPVQLESAGVIFSAVLRVGMHAGLTLESPSVPDITIFNHTIPKFGGGVEVGVFANVAEFITNITEQPNNEDCHFGVAQSYQIALGASAGASIFVSDVTWGPVATTSIPIYTTALGSTCVEAVARTTSATVEPTTAARKRQGMSTATTTSEITYTGVNCLSTGLINCPVSLQNTSQFTTTTTLTALVTPGADEDDIEWQTTVQNSVATTAAFGKNAVSVSSTSGKPVPYTPPPAKDTSLSGKIDSALDGDVNGTPKRVIVGVSVGLGVPFLIGLVVGAILISKKRSRKQSVAPDGSFGSAGGMHPEKLSAKR